jgi:hypothetical protein
MANRALQIKLLDLIKAPEHCTWRFLRFYGDFSRGCLLCCGYLRSAGVPPQSGHRPLGCTAALFSSQCYSGSTGAQKQPFWLGWASQIFCVFPFHLFTKNHVVEFAISCISHCWVVAPTICPCWKSETARNGLERIISNTIRWSIFLIQPIGAIAGYEGGAEQSYWAGICRPSLHRFDSKASRVRPRRWDTPSFLRWFGHQKTYYSDILSCPAVPPLLSESLPSTFCWMMERTEVLGVLGYLRKDEAVYSHLM